MNEASPNTDAIARELAALGEDPPSEAELALIGAALHDDASVASVERLAELAEPLTHEPLSELEGHRAWRGIEQRLDAETEAKTESGSPGAGAGARSGPPRWLFAAVGIAAAAVVALVVIPKHDSEAPRAAKLTADEVAKQGDAVRVALAALDDGRSDTARARSRLDAYRQQLEEQGG